MALRYREWHAANNSRKNIGAVGILLVGLFLGLLVGFTPLLPLPEDYKKLVYVVPFVAAVVILFNNPEKLILAAIAIGVPLNLDVSLIISPYARNFDNLSRGYRTLITTTELRISFVTIALFVGYLLWLVRPANVERKPVRLFATTTIPALGFILLTIISGIPAPDKQLWFFRTWQLAEVFLIYFYLVNHLDTAENMRFFIIVTISGLLAESVLMIFQWITGKAFFIAGIQAVMVGSNRVGGTLGHTGPAAGYLSAMALMATSMIWGFREFALKRLAVISMILSILALISTGSRIGYGAFGVTLIIFLLACLQLGFIKRGTLILLFVSIALVAIVFSGIITARFSSSLNDPSARSRPMMWKLAWKTIQANPIIGVGAGNYALVTRDYYSYDIGPMAEVYDKIVHNAYLGVWAETGTFSLICYLWMFAAAIMRAWSCKQSRHPLKSLLGVGLGLGILSLCIQMLTGTFYMRSITMFTWILVAMAAALPSVNLNPKQNDVAAPPCPKSL